MIHQEFILLIMNCKKYAKKALFQTQTWLKSIPSYIKYYHVIGIKDMEQEYIFDEETHILWIKVADDYNSLPKKVIRAYEAVYDTFSFHYIFKTDDDQVLLKASFFDTITNLVTNMIPSSHYGGYIIDVNTPYMSQYNKIHPELPKVLPLYKTKYCSGRFYFLSKSAISNLIHKRDRIETEYLEDYAIGFHLEDRFKTNMLSINTETIFADMDLSTFSQKI